MNRADRIQIRLHAHAGTVTEMVKAKVDHNMTDERIVVDQPLLDALDRYQAAYRDWADAVRAERAVPA